MKSAVIKTGGKQYFVNEGDQILVEKVLPGKSEKTISFSEVLLTATDKTIKVGTPLVKGAKVEAEIVTQAKAPKIHGVKMKAKKRNRHYFGHRQSLTKISITRITTA